MGRGPDPRPPSLAACRRGGTEAGAPAARPAPGARRALLALAAPAVLAAVAGPAFAGGRADAGPAVDSDRVFCWDEGDSAVARGAFRRGGEPTRLLLLSGGERGGCRIRHEGGRLPGRIDADGARFVTVCRDAASGRDHAVLHRSAGQHHDVEVWAADPETGNPERLYDEVWGDDAPTEPGAEWGTTGALVAADGACLWRARLEARGTVETALSALLIGRAAGLEHDEPGRIFALPTRAVPAETVRRWLTALEAIAAPEKAGRVAALEGAVYADDAARESWRVVQVLARTMYEAEGAVLLLDRRQGAWRTIYDVPSGGSKVLNFPMLGMTVRGDRLFASICIDCPDDFLGWDAYRPFEIDLRRNRATLLGREPESEPAENPPIHDVRRAVFSE